MCRASTRVIPLLDICALPAAGQVRRRPAVAKNADNWTDRSDTSPPRAPTRIYRQPRRVSSGSPGIRGTRRRLPVDLARSGVAQAVTGRRKADGFARGRQRRPVVLHRHAKPVRPVLRDERGAKWQRLGRTVADEQARSGKGGQTLAPCEYQTEKKRQDQAWHGPPPESTTLGAERDQPFASDTQDRPAPQFVRGTGDLAGVTPQRRACACDGCDPRSRLGNAGSGPGSARRRRRRARRSCAPRPAW